MTLFKEIRLIDYSRPITDTSRHAYRWSPHDGASKGRGFYQSSKGLAMDRAGSSFDLRLELANDVLPSRSRLSDVTGYYCDNFQSETMQPIIARLPRSRGFLAGWTMGEGMCASLDCDVYDDAEDAARAAHSMAEREAEREREYQEEEEERLRAEEEAEREADEVARESERELCGDGWVSA